ncbi:MAG: glycyl-radical enzyme activating protein [Prevotellaceae bacterium]|jgi:pyruvate formate lyase activating enzyme|nr:glycyl-radical enzyme activating protein [Prevotellaceae bacterium]
MTGTIFDIKRFTVHDGPGVRVTAFLKGCPLACKWCHNPEGVDPAVGVASKTVRVGSTTFTSNESVGYEITPDALMCEFRKEKIFMDESGGGVTFSGGEPLMQTAFLVETLALCKKEKIHTAVDTSGFAAWDDVEAVRNFTDLFLYDLKIMDDALHKNYTGVSNRLILENLVCLLKTGARVRIRIPMIPGVTFTGENMEQTLAFLTELPFPVEGVDLLPYHNTATHKYKRLRIANPFEEMKSLSKNDLSATKQRFEAAGLNIINN